MYVDNLIRRYIPDAVIYPQLTPEQYYGALGAADMCLDPFPFGNASTLIDYSSEVVPSVCLMGNVMPSRQSSWIMRRIGLPEWLVARSVEEYVEKGAMLARDAPRREELKKGLPDAFQPSKLQSLDLFRGDPGLVCRWFEVLIKDHDRLKRSGTKILRVSL